MESPYKIRLFRVLKMDKKIMHLIGIEPTHTAPEAIALSTELQMHLLHSTIRCFKAQEYLLIFIVFFVRMKRRFILQEVKPI